MVYNSERIRGKITYLSKKTETHTHKHCTLWIYSLAQHVYRWIYIFGECYQTLLLFIARFLLLFVSSPVHNFLLCIFLKCCFKLSFLLNLLPHPSSGQAKGLSDECDNICLLTCSGL